MKKGLQMVFILLLGAGIMLTGLPAIYGQEEEGEEREVFTLEEIVVTATKREEGILEVPITMSAFDDARIEALGMTNFADLEQLTAGLQFGSAATQQRSDGYGITIRGIGTQKSRELHTDLAVAMYVDGVYTVDTYGLAPNLFDIERVEVARGPQGTLHGRNSIAGAISLITKKPGDTWDAEVLHEFTDQVTQRWNVAFGGPIARLLGGGLSFRITGGYFDGEGAQENIGLGDDLDAPHQETISPKLRFKADRLDINLSYQRIEDTGSPGVLVRFAEQTRDNAVDATNWLMYDTPIPSVAKCNPPVIDHLWYRDGVPGWSPRYGPQICDDLENKVLSNRNGTQDSETERYTANVDLDITDGLLIRYTFGAAETHTLSSMDGDGTNRTGSADEPSIPSDLTSAEKEIWIANGLTFEDSETQSIFDNDENSHELQVITSFDGPLNFVAGVYYYKNEVLFQHATASYSNPWRFSDADAAAVAAGYASCEAYLASGVANPYGIDHLACPHGSDHTRYVSFFSSTDLETKAAFASVDFRISDSWFVSAGLRWTEDEKTRIPGSPPGFEGIFTSLPAGIVPNLYYIYDYTAVTTPDAPTGIPVAFGSVGESPDPRSWDATIGDISVEYMLDDSQLIYGRISTGYRAGGYNFEMEGIPSTFAEETLINYELGMKGVFLDGRLQMTSGVFYQDYEDFQFQGNQRKPIEYILSTDPSPYRELTVNVPDSAIWGAEIEATFFAGDRWQISGYYSYLDSEIGPHEAIIRQDPDIETNLYPFYLSWPGVYEGTVCTEEWIAAVPAAYVGAVGGCYVPVPRDNTGNQLPNQPHHKGALTVAYTMPMPTLGEQSISLGTLQLLTTFSYTGERWPNIGNIPRTEVPSYSRWDLRANWVSDSGRWSASLYVQNLLDEIGVAEFLSHDSIGSLTDPRQIGMQIRWKY